MHVGDVYSACPPQEKIFAGFCENRITKTHFEKINPVVFALTKSNTSKVHFTFQKPPKCSNLSFK